MTLIEKILSMGYEKKVAQSLIMAGKVLVNNEPILIGSIKIKETDAILIRKTKKWVSRGAYKLLKAFDEFLLNVENQICLDVGASTGGFTEVLLTNGAKKVYSLDSGTNQLDYKIRKNERVVVLEKTNLKNINQDMFQEKIDFVCCDVSFISVTHFFKALKISNVLANKNKIVVLIKPQFEAKYDLVEKGGFVNEKNHKIIIENLINYSKALNFKFIAITNSPIMGYKSKNKEYLALFELERNN